MRAAACCDSHGIAGGAHPAPTTARPEGGAKDLSAMLNAPTAPAATAPAATAPGGTAAPARADAASPLELRVPSSFTDLGSIKVSELYLWDRAPIARPTLSVPGSKCLGSVRVYIAKSSARV